MRGWNIFTSKYLWSISFYFVCIEKFLTGKTIVPWVEVCFLFDFQHTLKVTMQRSQKTDDLFLEHSRLALKIKTNSIGVLNYRHLRWFNKSEKKYKIVTLLGFCKKIDWKFLKLKLILQSSRLCLIFSFYSNLMLNLVI